MENKGIIVAYSILGVCFVLSAIIVNEVTFDFQLNDNAAIAVIKAIEAEYNETHQEEVHALEMELALCEQRNNFEVIQ